ncbi:hypothetical protein BBBOND_0203380 [Babesia bigemina]|uniref:Uncharacterized protein n=1 Tax=Babesia bigemina TaxID=5866 RepID=A0A061D347_BABBI|nr:hypothetical protein BBBOND_0203380 [Babesia bigemina]CDR95181.1 hypothetical protein BBBOND_0203380 [Babesia bigemina]|eukprot:XP_012767367.1 hypothetical protein BBBOND_0203380 [Babesia bigemina]
MLFDVYRESLLKLYYFLRDEPDAFDKSRSYPAARVDFGINMEPLLKKPEVEIDTPPTTFSATNSWNFYEPNKPTVLNM